MSLVILFNQHPQIVKYSTSKPEEPFADMRDDIERDDEEIMLLVPIFHRIIIDANTC